MRETLAYTPPETKSASELGRSLVEEVSKQLDLGEKAGGGDGEKKPEESLWDIITGRDGYLAGQNDPISALRRGWHKAGKMIAKIDQRLDSWQERPLKTELSEYINQPKSEEPFKNVELGRGLKSRVK